MNIITYDIKFYKIYKTQKSNIITLLATPDSVPQLHLGHRGCRSGAGMPDSRCHVLEDDDHSKAASMSIISLIT